MPCPLSPPAALTGTSPALRSVTTASRWQRRTVKTVELPDEQPADHGQRASAPRSQAGQPADQADPASGASYRKLHGPSNQHSTLRRRKMTARPTWTQTANRLFD